MNVPFLDLQAQYRAHKGEIDAAIRGVLDTSAYVLGPAVDDFERAFADFCDVNHCIGVNSGTSALTLLLEAHGIGPGDEVITVANTFFATAEAISRVGATVVLVDCDPATALMDPAAFAAAITPRTKAVLPVHLFGQTCDMQTINAAAKPKGVLVIEDACQAHGAKDRGRPAGSLADAAAFSFYPGKNLGAYGEAGAILTNDAAVAKRLRMAREHGSPKKYHHDLVGWNERMDGIQGAVLGVKLGHLDDWNAKRREHAARYRKLLPAGVTPIAERPNAEHAYHLFVIRVPERDRVQVELQRTGIATGIHYPVPVHLQPAYADRGWKRGQFPTSETLAEEILSLPMFPELTAAQIEAVCTALSAAVRPVVRAAAGNTAR